MSRFNSTTLCFLAFFSLTFSCASLSPPRVHGPLNMHLDGTDNTDIGLVLTFVSNKINRVFPSGWKIKLIQRWIVVPAGEDLIFADGYCDEELKEVLVYNYRSCLASTSLVHEVLHVYGYRHGEALDALEKELVTEATSVLCSPQYVPEKIPEVTQEDVESAVDKIYTD